MRKLFALSLVTLGLGACAHQTSLAYTHDTANQVNADRRYAHASNGQVILGPSLINEVVTGQKDSAGNVHTDPIPHPDGVTHY
jgi:hypothetical protein